MNAATFTGTRPLFLEAGTMVFETGANIGVEVFNQASIELGTSPGQVTYAEFTQDTTGELRIEIGGPTAGTQFDQVIVTGGADLDGSLVVSLIDLGGGLPVLSPGDMFEVLTAGAGLGSTMFADHTFPVLPGGLTRYIPCGTIA